MMPVKSKRHNEEGFTLLEVLVAISILTFGLLAIGSMQVTSIRGNHFAGKVTDGTYLACDKMEDLMSRSYVHADLDPVGNTHIDPSPPAGFTVEWVVAADSPLVDTKTVTVTVKWQDHGKQKTASVRQVVPRII